MGAGTVLGAMLGLMAGLLVGSPWAIVLLLIAGGFAGRYYDAQHALPPEDPEALSGFSHAPYASAHDATSEAALVPREEEPYEQFASDLCAVFVEVAHADGEVRRDEVRVVRRYFQTTLGYGPEALEVVRSHLKVFLAHPPDLDAAVSACHAQLPSAERHRLLDTLYELALADGGMQRSEREVLRRVAEGLGISEADEQAIIALHLGAGDEHYAALGLTPDATDVEVKRAFRQLAAEHHPDKSAHLGRQAAEQAARRFQQIRDAYEEIRRLRGL
ncbi:TerB family tellurite resistance protein [Myxococcus xanthus]|uniref:TerB family tellurite resistance protein n=1 Tax=Myxococcus xanthus TaxID=34 RepID=UPI0019174D07|nr:TerB family tellurite resistance protein [Myxococcus xanthus]QQR47267.1 TerB family tellurite resistance protein [Myxococcus xanthus]